MRNVFELIYNPKNLDFEPKIINAIEEEMSEISQEDLTGLCKFLAINIKENLQQKGINSKIINFNELSDVNHYSLISEDGENTFLIDPTYQQFCSKEGYRLINNQKFFDQKLNNPGIAEQLKNKGYINISQQDFEDYMNSFIK